MSINIGMVACKLTVLKIWYYFR